MGHAGPGADGVGVSGKMKVGVMKFDVSKEVDPAVGELVYSLIQQYLIENGRYAVVDWEEIGRVMKLMANAQPNVSEDDARQMAVKQLGIEKLYMGQVLKIGSRYHLLGKIVLLDLSVEASKRAVADDVGQLERATRELAVALGIIDLVAEQKAAAKAAANRQAAQIADHLASARAASARQDWAAVIAAAEKVLALDAGHGEARRLRDEAKSRQLRVPTGFRAAPGARPEPYTNTGWVQSIIHEAIGIELVYIPAGSFTMGSPKSEQDAMVAAGSKREWAEDEIQHQVTLSQGFYMGKTEVTQGQWQKLMGNNPSYFKNAGSDAPVESVSWDDCQEFCRRAGFGLRLPTEAEWEYACRAGTTTALYSGGITILGQCNAPALDLIAWYGGNSGVTYEGGYDSSGWLGKQYNHSWAGTHPVGRKQANAWGLYDMIGNVWEWCQDWYGTYPAGAVRDPTGAAGGSSRVLRGGGWFDYASYCRSAFRIWSSPSYRDSDLGFRLVRTVP